MVLPEILQFELLAPLQLAVVKRILHRIELLAYWFRAPLHHNQSHNQRQVALLAAIWGAAILLQLRRIAAFYLHELLIFYSRTHVDSGPSILLNLIFSPSRVTAGASSNSSYDPADQLFKFLLA